MIENQSRTQSRRFTTPREIFLPVKVYISNQAAAALRKPNPRKKAEKRESSRPLSILSDDNQRRVKEKTSWLNLARGATTSDQWRQATCRLTEEEEGCVLNVYLEETILFQSVHLHLLLHTDIRPADPSLFFRKDCLGIHCSADQRWSATHSTEPLYCAFPSTEAMNTWMALLRSYAAPEVYGNSRAQGGGTYRVWRQVELTCIQGRNIGVPRFVDPASNLGVAGDTEGRGDSEAVDLDLFCEVYFNSVLSGRTVVKKSMGSPDWHESFLFTDLPPFEKLAIVVWREKKLQKPSNVGTVYITLTNFRRGEHVEGWFPILFGGSASTCTQVGQLRLKLKVDEEIVLPYSKYSKVVDTLDRRNYLDWMIDLDVKFKTKQVSGQLFSIAIAKNILLSNVFEVADREVDGTPSSHHTLFRGNTVLTKTIESLMGWYGKNFLEASVGFTIRRLCFENVSIEVDPLRNAKGPKDVERNVDLLVYWCREIWEQIYSTKHQCPHEMRKSFEYIRQLVEKRYPSGPDADTNSDLPRQSVSAFCFLRFIVPAILHPHLFGLCSGLPDMPVQRSLTLIAKVIQSLANLNATVQKEEFMRGVKSFLEERLPEMFDYILVVSTPGPDESPQPSSDEAHIRSRAVRALNERKQAMSDLKRESIPHLTHFLDIPRHLAIVTSTVVRYSRDLSPPQDPIIADLYNQCLDVEQQALYHVSRQTAPRDNKRPVSSLVASSEPSLPTAIRNYDIIEVPQPVSPSKPRRTSLSKSRPKTAPPSAVSTPSLHSRASSRHSQEFSISELNVLAETMLETPKEGDNLRLSRRQVSHPRSISTDSIPEFRDATPGGMKTLVEAMRPQNAERKKGFLRNMLIRK
ncbi:Rho GTPase activation protein [Multifurca ochricompacta]|uniref:Rho GTPase activation protein n=1 Tax=Multifurca ochricompacta TaxID=376703 RepID=A0AAD4QQQ1_9AGAM|nr:Rho GTPase activation protein [Multifurca ochricompacta]